MKLYRGVLLSLFVAKAIAQVAHYPLHIGDRWQYFLIDPGHPAIMIEYRVASDTVMPNGNRYAVYAHTRSGSIHVWYPTYQRQVGSRVLLYNPQSGHEYLLYDFARSVGDSLGFYVVHSDTFDVFLTNSQLGNFWGVQRRTWSFGHRVRHLTDGSKSTLIVDSLGLYQYSLDAEPYHFGGAVISGRTYGTIVAVTTQPADEPKNPVLHQNVPNPLNPSTTIKYQIPNTKHVTLKVFDILGCEVVTLVDEVQEAGYHNVQWSTNNGRLSSGVYLYRLQAGDFVATKKLVLMK